MHLGKAVWGTAATALLGLTACGTDDLQPIRAGDSGTGLGDAAARVDGQRDAGAGKTPDGAKARDGAGTPPTPDAGVVCKRGIATNAAPTSVFAPTASAPGVAWWYNWSTKAGGGDGAIEFVPMVWGSASLGDALPTGSRYVLGFNEPNFKAQSDLTASQGAADWPMVEAVAKTAGAYIVSPAVNYCGSSSDPSQCTDPQVTDPYTYLKDFFSACPACEVDYIAVHWYNCDLPSLQGYLEGNEDAGGGLQGFTQFGKPIWLTEFACDGSHSVADQMAYMQAAVPYLENNPHIYRYSWFSASNIPNALLANTDGSLTPLGQTYVGLAESCK